MNPTHLSQILLFSTFALLSVPLLSSQAVFGDANDKMLKTQYAGFSIDTEVDSNIVQTIFDIGDDANSDTLSNKSQLPELSCGSLAEIPEAQALEKLTEQYSTDTATALLIKCLYNIPEINASQHLFLDELEQHKTQGNAQQQYLSEQTDDYIIFFVPGWDYQSNGHKTGADLKKPREIISAAGFENILVSIEQNGSVEGNAEILKQHIDEFITTGKKIIFVSASSGGPTVEFALSDPRFENHPQISGWLNICGVLNGSPVLDQFEKGPKAWFFNTAMFLKGWNKNHIRGLSRSNSTERHSNASLPSQLTVLNYIGIPFSGQMSKFGQQFYPMLKKLGPNDGLTLITEALIPSHTVLAIGTDHFIREDPEIDLKTAALLPTLLRLIEQDATKRGQQNATTI